MVLRLYSERLLSRLPMFAVVVLGQELQTKQAIRFEPLGTPSISKAIASGSTKSKRRLDGYKPTSKQRVSESWESSLHCHGNDRRSFCLDSGQSATHKSLRIHPKRLTERTKRHTRFIWTLQTLSEISRRSTHVPTLDIDADIDDQELSWKDHAKSLNTAAGGCTPSTVGRKDRFCGCRETWLTERPWLFGNLEALQAMAHQALGFNPPVS
jgi:hypothetical protein